MRKKGYKGRCEKKNLSKSMDVCRSYDAIQSVYADILQQDENIQEIRCNVLLDGLSEGDYQNLHKRHYYLVQNNLHLLVFLFHQMTKTNVHANVHKGTMQD